MKKGQALLVVLLVLGVAMTVGLSVVSRSVTEVSISTTQEESTKALEAAEAGIEKSLAGVDDFGYVDGYGKTVTFTNNSTAFVYPDNLGESNQYILPYKLEAGDVATLYMYGYTGNKLRICWGGVTGSPVAEVTIYTKTASAINLYRKMLGGSFYSVNISGCPSLAEGGKFWYDLDSSDYRSESPIMLRIRMLNTSTAQPVAFLALGGGNLMAQGKDTLSTGMSGQVRKSIRVYELTPDLPFMFDSALFSGTSLEK
jgi:hypothetical protein